MRFVVDAQLPPALVRLLAAAGHQAEHVADVGLRDADDGVIWQYAIDQRAIIVTKDEDFAARSLRTDTGPVIVWLRVGNTSSRALSQWMTPLLSQIVDHVQRGDRLIEAR